MADDNVQLVTKDGSSDMAVEYPRYAAHHIQPQPLQNIYQYDQPVVQQPAMEYNQPGMDYDRYEMVIEQDAPELPPSYLCISCTVFWCCNPVVGGIAMLFSLLSKGSTEENRMVRAKWYSRAALWTSMFGVLLGVIGFILMAYIIIKVDQKAHDDYEKVMHEEYP